MSLKNKFIFLFFLISISRISIAESSKDSLLKLIEKAPADTNKINHFNELAIHYIGHSPDSTLYFGEAGLKLAEEISWKKGIANSLHAIGYAHYVLGNFDKTLEKWKKALLIRESLKINKDISASLSNIAAVYLYQGKHPEALEYNFKALKIDERDGNLKGVESTSNNIGNIYKYQGEYQKALEYYSRSVKINEELGNESNLSALLSNIGIIYNNQGEHKKALEHFLKALTINEKLGNRNHISVITGNIGNVYKNMNDLPLALDYFSRALMASQAVKNKNHIVSWMANIGNVYLKMGKVQEAEKHLTNALSLSDSIGSLNESMKLEESLSELYLKMGSYERAYLFYKKFSNSKDSLFDLEKNKQITEMQTKYETEKKQQENEILLNENEIKTLEIVQQKNQRTIMATVFGFLFLTGFLFFNRIRLQQKNKILLEKESRAKAVFQAQEQEKIHLSKELHDGLGPLLSLIKLNASSIEVGSGNEKLINEIKDLASDGMKEVRVISHALMPLVLEKKGLEQALLEIMDQINQTNKIGGTLSFSIPEKLSSEIELNIYRIIQESLNNIIKHAEATMASISLVLKKQQIEITISDNGKGFDPEKNSPGNGINNIHSRVDFLKGKFQINSSPAKGTILEIFIPL